MCFFSLGVEGGLAADRLDALLPPALLAGVGDVHELGADGAAVGLAQRLQDLAQRHVLVGREVRVRRRERDVHVGFGQVVERRIELGDARTLGALERIEVGPARAEEAVGGDQRLDVDLLARDGQVGRAGLDGEGVGLGALRERLDRPARAGRRGRRSRRRRARAAARRSTRARCPAPSRGSRGRPRTSPRRRARCRRTGRSWTCFAPSSFAHLLPRFPGLRWVDQPSAARLDRLADCKPPCCWKPARGHRRTHWVPRATNVAP